DLGWLIRIDMSDMSCSARRFDLSCARCCPSVLPGSQLPLIAIKCVLVNVEDARVTSIAAAIVGVRPRRWQGLWIVVLRGNHGRVRFANPLVRPRKHRFD